MIAIKDTNIFLADNFYYDFSTHEKKYKRFYTSMRNLDAFFIKNNYRGDDKKIESINIYQTWLNEDKKQYTISIKYKKYEKQISLSFDMKGSTLDFNKIPEQITKINDIVIQAMTNNII